MFGSQVNVNTDRITTSCLDHEALSFLLENMPKEASFWFPMNDGERDSIVSEEHSVGLCVCYAN